MGQRAWERSFSTAHRSTPKCALMPFDVPLQVCVESPRTAQSHVRCWCALRGTAPRTLSRESLRDVPDTWLLCRPRFSDVHGTCDGILSRVLKRPIELLQAAAVPLVCGRRRGAGTAAPFGGRLGGVGGNGGNGGGVDGGGGARGRRRNGGGCNGGGG